MEGKDSGPPSSTISPPDTGVKVEPKPMVINVTQSTEFHGDLRDTYRVRSKPKGWVLLINNEEFQCDKYPTRTGAEVDEKNLHSLFSQLGLRVLIRRNLKYAEMRRELSNFADMEDHKFSDMAMVCICSHGVEKDKIISSDCKEMDIREDILSKFNNEGSEVLRGKPKLFMFQACRGSKEDFGIIEERTRSGPLRGPPGASTFKRSPVWEDMLMIYSTIPGYVSIRNFEEGAWFVQCFCKVLMERAHNTSMRRMLDSVAWELREYQGDEGNVESCTYESQNFYKQLYLNPGMYEL